MVPPGLREIPGRGVYYGPGTSGSVAEAEIFGANYFGVVVNAAAVDVTNSSIHNIGEVPFDGSQHGVAVYYTGATASGTISGNTIDRYQKGGITVSNDAAATITGNAVTGLGSIDYIAQNGEQIRRQRSEHLQRRPRRRQRAPVAHQHGRSADQALLPLPHAFDDHR